MRLISVSFLSVGSSSVSARHRSLLSTPEPWAAALGYQELPVVPSLTILGVLQDLKCSWATRKHSESTQVGQQDCAVNTFLCSIQGGAWGVLVGRWACRTDMLQAHGEASPAFSLAVSWGQRLLGR